MQAQEIFDVLKKQFPDAVTVLNSEPSFDPFISVETAQIENVALFCRDDEHLQFDFLMCLSGMDLKENLGVVYHLYSTKIGHRIVLKVTVPKDNPKVPTVERVWRTADWHERECFDLVGVIFEGHHNLIRILCPYDWEGHPLQKDYKTPEEYHGMKVPY